MSEYVKGQRVRLVPSQGCHQKERSGVVVRLTSKQIVVQPADTMSEIRFRVEDGKPVYKIDQKFPCYVVKSE